MDMSDMKQHFGEGQDRLARDLRAVVDDAEALLQLAVRDAGAGYAEARTRLEQSLASAKSELSAVERAWTAVGVGTALGLVLGLFAGRR